MKQLLYDCAKDPLEEISSSEYGYYFKGYTYSGNKITNNSLICKELTLRIPDIGQYGINHNNSR